MLAYAINDMNTHIGRPARMSINRVAIDAGNAARKFDFD